MFEPEYEVWDRVTGDLVGAYGTREEAEAVVPGTYQEDFIILKVDED